MKSKIDVLLIVAMAACYTAGQIFAADRFAMAAFAMLVIFVIRLLGGTITWIITGR